MPSTPRAVKYQLRRDALGSFISFEASISSKELRRELPDGVALTPHKVEFWFCGRPGTSEHELKLRFREYAAALGWIIQSHE